MEQKVCSQCGLLLPITEFHWRNKSLGTHRSECKKCHNKYMTNKNIENRTIIQNQKKENKCAKCGETRWYLLDYHHINANNKVDTVSRLMVHSSLENAQEEIKKCILLCANCHREFHHFNKESNLTLEEYLK